MADWPTCNPFAENVKAAPLVVALFPLLPAMATIKLPFCGPLTTVTESVPKRLVAVMLATSTIVGLNIQVNSALANPPVGTLFKLTVAIEAPPTIMLDGVRSIVTNADVVEIVGVADGTLDAVGIGVFVGIGVEVAAGEFVAVGIDGKLAGFPGKVRELNSWVLLNPSPSESRFSINPKAALFLPLAL